MRFVVPLPTKTEWNTKIMNPLTFLYIGLAAACVDGRTEPCVTESRLEGQPLGELTAEKHLDGDRQLIFVLGLHLATGDGRVLGSDVYQRTGFRIIRYIRTVTQIVIIAKPIVIRMFCWNQAVSGSIKTAFANGGRCQIVVALAYLTVVSQTDIPSS